MLTHRLLFFKNSKVSPSLQKYTVTWLDLKSCTHPKHEERLIPRSFFLIYKPNPPVNRAFNQKKNILYPVCYDGNRTHWTVQTHEMDTT